MQIMAIALVGKFGFCACNNREVLESSLTITNRSSSAWLTAVGNSHHLQTAGWQLEVCPASRSSDMHCTLKLNLSGLCQFPHPLIFDPKLANRVVSWPSGEFVKTWRKRKASPVKAGNQRSEDSRLATKDTPKMHLNEYMVTVERPLGLRFAQTLSGKIYVEALAKQGNAEKERIIMVGDVLKKISAVSGDSLVDVEDLESTRHAIQTRNGRVNLVFERSSPTLRSSFSINAGPFNAGRVAVATWNSSVLVPPYQASDEAEAGRSGFAIYSSKYLSPKGLYSVAKAPGNSNVDARYPRFKDYQRTENKKSFRDKVLEVVNLFSDEDGSREVEWSHGTFKEDEFINALARGEGDLVYNPFLGINVSKITEHIFVGSCVQSESDLRLLVERYRITAILNLQPKSEQESWEIDGQAIANLAQQEGLVVIDCPIRDVDAVDLRRKLPYTVGALYRLLRKGHRVFVTCTTGLDRSPACVIAYLHWIQDVALQEAIEYINNLHRCGPDRPAIVWATWDLIAMAEKEDHKGPPTHSVQFVWNHGCREGEEVLLVGEFQGGWNEPIRAVHGSGPKYTVDLRLPQGKYHYKFIVGGEWKHSGNLPTEVDRWGNINNVIRIGDVATPYFRSPHRVHVKELTTIKVIERPLTEDERFTLAFAARLLAFRIDPSTFSPKT